MTDTLESLAGRREFEIGCAVSAGSLRGDPDYRKTIGREFSMVTPENCMKMGPLRPDPDTYDFSDADALVGFAAERDLRVRGHALVWHRMTPDWFLPWEYTDDQLRAFLRDHVYTVAGRYRHRLDAWDVVNEAIDDDATWRESPWHRAMGTEYVDRAFEWADEVAPDVDLYYNDYGAEGLNDKSDAVYDLVSGLVEREVPIDGVGLQLHVVGTDGDRGINREAPAPADVAANVERLRELGLEVQITEMDVAIDPAADRERALEEQAEYYGEIVEACLDAGADALVTWGVHDGSSWLQNRGWAGDDPLLFDDDFQPKPAYDAVAAALSRE